MLTVAMASDSEVIRTPTAEIYLADDGIIRMNFLPDVQMTRQDAVENLAAVEVLCGDQKRACLADVRTIGSADQGNREYAADPKHTRYLAAMAILADSPFTRTLMNLFMLVSRPAYPTQMFADEAEAIEWLRQYL